MKTAEQTIRLEDGRDIAVVDQGNRGGRPVVYLHGTPDSNKTHIQHEDFYREKNLRVVSVNRPGTGISSYDTGWSAVSFADDLRQVLDRLEIDMATVVGFSAGGLHACTFAYCHPGRVSRLGLISSVGPFDLPSLGDKRSEAIKSLHHMASEEPTALLAQFATINTPEAMLALLNAILPPVDQAVLAQPQITVQCLLAFADVLEQGLEPFVTETRICNAPWGFSPADISVDTLLWHGTADMNVPIECSRYLAEQIPNTRAFYVEGAGHYFSFEQWQAILLTLTAT